MSQSSTPGKDQKPKKRRFAQKVKKPDFQTEEALLASASYSALYKRFRESGLGVPDAFFNALYTVISEKNVLLLEERMREAGLSPTAEQKNDLHTASLRFLAFFPRFFRRFADGWRALGKRLFHRDPGGRSYRASYRFFRTHLPHVLVILFVLICSYLVARTLAVPVVLEARIDGKILGVVESNTVVDSALRELENNVSGILGKSFQFPYEIEYDFVRKSRAETTDKTEISKILYTYLPDYITTGAGLYVDDALVAVCATEADVRAELSDVTAAHVGQGADVGIFNEILVITQAYPAGSVIDRGELRELLEKMTVPPEDREGAGQKEETAVSPAALPEQNETVAEGTLLCDVQIPTIRASRKASNQPVGIEHTYLTFYRSEVLRYQENIPFTTEYTESPTLYTSMADITTFGEAGKNNMEARVYYVDGKEVKREILSETVVKPPRNQVVTMGTRVLPEELGITGQKGYFIMPRCAAISSPYGERELGFHQGWDIPGPTGANVYAAASGTVVAAIGQDGGFTYTPETNYTGYGYCVILEHENGLSTLYAHCSKICVTLGQEVKQGEKIAEVGETGEAYGSHIHFEIRQGGTRLDPANGYMYEGKTTVYDRMNAASTDKKS